MIYTGGSLRSVVPATERTPQRLQAGCGSAGAAGAYGRHVENAAQEIALLLQLAFPTWRPQPPGKRSKRFPQPLGKPGPAAGRQSPVSHRSTASTTTIENGEINLIFPLTFYRGTIF